MRLDDLAPLLVDAGGSGVGFRQGAILAWNPTTAENTVSVGGSTLVNLPILNSAESLLLQPGAVVGILTAGSTWWILGRITVPGTPDAAQTLGASIGAATTVGNIEISSAGFASAGGPSVSTTVSPTGRVVVVYGATADCDVGERVALAVYGSGPNDATAGPTVPANVGCSLTVSTGTLGGTMTASGGAADVLTGLAPGLWTFEVQYRKLAGTGHPAVSARYLTVLPF